MPNPILSYSSPAIDKQLRRPFVAEPLVKTNGVSVIHRDFQMDGKEGLEARLMLNGCQQGGPDAATTVCPADVQSEAPQRIRPLAASASEADSADWMAFHLCYEHLAVAIHVLPPTIGQLSIIHLRFEGGYQTGDVAWLRFPYQELGVFRIGHDVPEFRRRWMTHMP